MAKNPSWHKLSREGGWEGGSVSEWSAGSLFSGPESQLDRLRLWGPEFQPRGKNIGVRAGGARGAAAPPNFGQLRFFGQREKIWAKPVLKDVSMFI